jgi:hypothetical protein
MNIPEHVLWHILGSKGRGTLVGVMSGGGGETEQNIKRGRCPWSNQLKFGSWPWDPGPTSIG